MTRARAKCTTLRNPIHFVPCGGVSGSKTSNDGKTWRAREVNSITSMPSASEHASRMRFKDAEPLLYNVCLIRLPLTSLKHSVSLHMFIENTTSHSYDLALQSPEQKAPSVTQVFLELETSNGSRTSACSRVEQSNKKTPAVSFMECFV
jgi:hypothetical protein